MLPGIFPQGKIFLAYKSGFISNIWPDIRPSQILDIQQGISGIRPDTGYKKLAGYPAHP